ncbi:MAG: hypothetical protein SGI97_09845 [candidate division Zixibacteria bacterium]|nr:hypothetical protein [candidate division Zixibacteria bacterium]
MISSTLLIYCLIAAGAYLLIISLLSEYVSKKLRLTESIPSEILEESSGVWWLMNFMMESLFFVVIPTLAYGFFAFVLPFSGTRAAMAAALFAFLVGAAPALMSLSVRLKLPLSWLLFLMLSLLIKLGGSLIIIGYVYLL